MSVEKSPLNVDDQPLAPYEMTVFMSITPLPRVVTSPVTFNASRCVLLLSGMPVGSMLICTVYGAVLSSSLTTTLREDEPYEPSAETVAVGTA